MEEPRFYRHKLVNMNTNLYFCYPRNYAFVQLYCSSIKLICSTSLELYKTYFGD